MTWRLAEQSPAIHVRTTLQQPPAAHHSMCLQKSLRPIFFLLPPANAAWLRCFRSGASVCDALTFESLDLEYLDSSFLVRRYIFRMVRLSSYIKVIAGQGQGQGHGSKKCLWDVYPDREWSAFD